MYPILTTIAAGVLIFGLLYSIFKAARQAQVPQSEQSGNAVGKIFWIYVAWAVIVFGGILLYAFYRL